VRLNAWQRIGSFYPSSGCFVGGLWEIRVGLDELAAEDVLATQRRCLDEADRKIDGRIAATDWKRRAGWQVHARGPGRDGPDHDGGRVRRYDLRAAHRLREDECLQ
jgi:hypothetical protein